MAIYKRKISRKKEENTLTSRKKRRKHAVDQEKKKENTLTSRKKRKQDLDQAVDQEKGSLRFYLFLTSDALPIGRCD